MTLATFGGYFLGVLHGQSANARWRDFFASCTRSLSRSGFAWSLAAPLVWTLVFYGLVAHVRLALGRWPRFGESLSGTLTRMHFDLAWYLGMALLGSLYVAPIVLIGSLFLVRWRHVSVYSLIYATAVGAALASIFLAPRPFLNWFFD